MKKNCFKIAILMIFAMVVLFMLTGSVNATEKVAKIGATEYETLADAVAAAPKDGTETTITLLKTVEDGTGFKTEAGQNVIIDFNNYSYDASNPLVGSAGTVTNGCQFLKGSTVKFKNGTLISTSAKILIQNYSNLTLENMNISSTNAEYVSSNNCGKVNIIGNTSITAKEGAYAFDMCWAPNKGYAEGTQIVVDTTGTIKGKIELDVWGTFSDSNGIKSTLNIKNVKHIGTFTIDERLADQLTIEGGTYTTDVLEYVKTGYTTLKVSDTEYKVGPKATGLTVASSLDIVVGNSSKLEPTVAPTNTVEVVKYSTDDAKVATVDATGKISAIAVGKAKITVTVGTIVKECIVNVKEVVIEGTKAEVSESKVTDAIEEAVEKENASVILDLKEEGKTITVAQIPTGAIADIKDAEKALEVKTTNATITLDAKALGTIIDNAGAEKDITLKFEALKEEDLNTKQKEAIKDKKVAMIISAEIMAGSKTISDFDGGKATIKIPFTPEEGTDGKDYKIIYIADDGTVEEVATKYENGSLTVELKHFSEYVVVKDTANEKDNTPKTGSINYIGIIVALGAIALIGTIALNKKK